ncbi:MAG: Sec-independent protein translocase protein TatB [Gemmobacter sp.]
MFDLGMSELLVIGIVALIVIGPKDLPVMFRTMGRFTAKARNMAREFSRAMEAAADESGVKDVAKDLRKVTDPKSMGLDALKDAASRFEAWDPKRSARPEPAAPAPAPAPAPAHGPATQALAESRAAQSAAAAEAAAAMRAARDGEPGQGT